MDDAIKRAQAERRAGMVSLTDFSASEFDAELYGNAGPKQGGEYVSELADEPEADAPGGGSGRGSHPATRLASLPQRMLAEMAGEGDGSSNDPMEAYRQQHGSGLVNTRISDREDKYHARHRMRKLSPERGGDAFDGKTPARSYADIMAAAQLEREKSDLLYKLERQKQDGTAAPAAPAVSAAGAAAAAAAAARRLLTESVAAPPSSSSSSAAGGGPAAGGDVAASSTSGGSAAAPVRAKRRRWDDAASSSAASVTGAATVVGGEALEHGSLGAGSSQQQRLGRSGGGLPPGGDTNDAVRASSGGGGGGSVSRWDATPRAGTGGLLGDSEAGEEDDAISIGAASRASAGAPPSSDAAAAASRRSRRWDATPVMMAASAAPSSASSVVHGDATPAYSSRLGGGEDEEEDGESWEGRATAPRSSAFSAAAAAAASALAAATRKRSRWDETPAAALTAGGAATPAGLGVFGDAATPAGAGSGGYVGATPTPSGLLGAQTPFMGGGGGAVPATPEQAVRARVEADLEVRNAPLSDADLDAILPSKGYKTLDPPAGYVPIRTPTHKLLATPTPFATPGFRLTETPARDAYGVPATPGEQQGAGSALPFVRPEDMQYFGKLVDSSVKDEELTPEEAVERRIMQMLLKIKNGTPPQRKVALKQITEKAVELGAGPLFNQILPLLMSPTLEDQERHLLVKVIDRLLFRLEDRVRPFVHKLLVVIEPMLIDEDYFARIEGREIIANLAKAAGLATMIATIRPDIDNPDEYVRNTTSRALAVVASALGVPALLPFLKAVTASKKSWQARHTGAKVVQQLSILVGCAVLPHLRSLVDTVAVCLGDEQQKVRIQAALALAALAEAAAPYGIESFDAVLRPLWKGIRTARGKALAAFLKAIGYIIPLMDAQYAAYYTREVMGVLIREFASPDEEMKKIVLAVVRQCVGTEGVEAAYVSSEILPEFFKCFWVRRMALDKRNYRALVDTTVALAAKVGAGPILDRICDDLKDESEPYRRMVLETAEKVVAAQGAADIAPRLEERLVDGILYAFQEQTAAAEEAGGGGGAGASSPSKGILNGFGVIVNALGGSRIKPYLPQIAGTIKWRLNNKGPTVRQQAAELISRIAGVMVEAGEGALLGHLGVVLYECLGEEYPDVLGAILGGLRSIVAVIGMEQMQPPIKDLLPRLTPILKNRAETVQENVIDLVGRIADRGAEHVSAREWMRVSFELLEMLKAKKKAIRRACVNTFGYIAKAIGPQDVLHALLNNLKVQERQNRVCTTVAIAIVAETCAPFTVLPALMNEYRVPDLNTQNGVLKALSFMFEYIGGLAKDYVYAVTPLLADALADRDLVHRQTAAWATKHLTLGLAAGGASGDCDDALGHLLNYLWPNVLETSPHVIQAVFEAVEAMRVALGPQRIYAYVTQGLFHPARRVREVYWKLYNNLYVYCPDALTPLYPRLEDVPPEITNSELVALVAAEAEEAKAGGDQGAHRAAAEGDGGKEQRARYARTYLQLIV